MPPSDRIEAWAKESVGFVSHSKALPGYKCADQVSQILRRSTINYYPSFAVAELIHMQKDLGWHSEAKPRHGCLAYSLQTMPIRRSHVGVVVRSDGSLRRQVFEVIKEYSDPTIEIEKERKETIAQLPLVNSIDRYILSSRLENWSKYSESKIDKANRLSSRVINQYAAIVFNRYLSNHEEGELTIVHNHITALREGPFNMDDIRWMANAKFLCPK